MPQFLFIVLGPLSAVCGLFPVPFLLPSSPAENSGCLMFYARELPIYGLQVGKKALDTIFAVCPLVALLKGRKYGRFSGGLHGSAGMVPHGYPPMKPRLDRRLIQM